MREHRPSAFQGLTWFDLAPADDAGSRLVPVEQTNARALVRSPRFPGVAHIITVPGREAVTRVHRSLAWFHPWKDRRNDRWRNRPLCGGAVLGFLGVGWR